MSPSFQLCVSTEAVEDSVSVDVTCGTTVWPVVRSTFKRIVGVFFTRRISCADVCRLLGPHRM